MNWALELNVVRQRANTIYNQTHYLCERVLMLKAHCNLILKTNTNDLPSFTVFQSKARLEIDVAKEVHKLCLS